MFSVSREFANYLLMAFGAVSHVGSKDLRSKTATGMENQAAVRRV